MNFKLLKKTRIKTLLLTLIGPIIIIGGSLVAIFVFNLQMLVTAISAVVMIVLLFVYSVFVIQPITDNYKKVIYKETLKDIFSIEEFCFKSSLKTDYLTSKCLLALDEKDQVETYNYMKCRWENVFFHVADISILNGNANRKNKENKIKNAGVWGVVEFSKFNFNELYIIGKNKTNLNLIRWLDKDKRLKKLTSRSEKLNSNFYIYSVNETTKSLDDNLSFAILRLKDTTKGDICFHIIDSKIHFLILNNQEPFEPEIKKDINKNKIEEIKRKYKNVLHFIQNLASEK